MVPEMTAGDLANALMTSPERLDDPVELRILDAEGNVVIEGVVRLSVGTGVDFDRAGGYQWTVITGQLD